jgi:hypothetical protein
MYDLSTGGESQSIPNGRSGSRDRSIGKRHHRQLPDSLLRQLQREEEIENWLEHGAPIGPEAAYKAVNRYEILAIGNRPVDHAGRDVLYSSLLRDFRVPKFRELVRELSGSIDRVRARAGRKKQSCEIQAFGLLWQRYVGQLLQLPVRGECGETGLLRNLSLCSPIGAYFNITDTDGAVARRSNCQRSWICPYCHGRDAVRLVERIGRGPWASGNRQGKQLVRLRASILTDELGLDQSLLDEDRKSYWDWLPLGDILANTTPSPTCESRREQWEEDALREQSIMSTMTAYEFDAAEKVGRQLMRLARSLGIAGGIRIHLVGPRRCLDGRRGFVHDLSVIGEVTFTDAAAARQFEQAAGLVEGAPHLHIMLNGEPVPVEWLVLPPERRDAPRVLITGTGGGYQLDRLQARMNAAASEAGRCGIQGAMAWQPLFLLDAAQFWSFYFVTRRRQRYSAFGNWQGGLPVARGFSNRRQRRESEKLPAGDRREHRRQVALRELETKCKTLGVRRVDIADAIGVSPQFVGDILAGRKSCTEDRFAQIMAFIRDRARVSGSESIAAQDSVPRVVR